MIRVENLVGGYKEPIIKGLQLEVKKGEFFVLLGPNGSGKSTLFKLLTGQLLPQAGSIFIDGKPLSAYSKMEKAKKIAVLTQETNVTFDYTVEEIVSLGRYPHQTGWFKLLSKRDRDVIDEAMKTTKVIQFRDQYFRSLSGGEKQRVLLAKALAQEPEILLLDEPTNHLDVKHTFAMLDQLKKWQRNEKLTVFAILHDLNVASLYADRIGLLHNGTLIDVGDVCVMKNEKQLQAVYDVDMQTQPHPSVAKPQLLMTPAHIDSSEKSDVFSSYSLYETDRSVEITFREPLRVFSNVTINSGVQWSSKFCLMERRFHSFFKDDSAYVVIEGTIEETVQHCGRKEGVDFIVVVVRERRDERVFHLNVFIDGKLTDGDLLDYYAAAVEAKMSALQTLNVRDSERSFDTLLIASTQRGPDLTKQQRLLIKRELKKTMVEALIQPQLQREVQAT